jgi:hypothetical protein
MLWLYIMASLFLLWMIINLQVVASIRRMESPESHVDVIENGDAVLREGSEYASRARWAEANGFEPDMMIDFYGGGGSGRITMGIWKNRDKRIYFCSYDIVVKDKIAYEFSSELNKDSDLSTSNIKDSMLFPDSPGSYKQAFDRLDLDALFIKHENATTHLQQHRNLSVVERAEPMNELMLESFHRLVTHVKSLPLWQLRGAYWFFIRRYRMNNKSIAQQYPA